MNKNKKLAKILCTSMVIGNITPAFATVINETNTYDDTTENVSKETEVLYQKAGNYFVTIPKTISLGADKQSPYSVKVEGDIPSDKQVYVSPIDGIKDTEAVDFYMHDTNTANPKADVVATVTQNKFYWNFSEVANGYSETDNKVTAKDLTSGHWKGTFDFEINMKAVNGDESHTHSYTETIIKEPTCTEDGEKKLTCSCGDTKTETIPSTGHNIIDGSCTKCGAVVKTIEDLMNGDVSYEKGTILSVNEGDTLKVNDTVITDNTFTFDKEGDYKVTVETTNSDGTPIIININITIIINQETHTHSYTETIIKAATCTESGEKTLTCSCGDTKTESIPATGHNYGVDDKCTNCGELNPNHKHNYTETVIKDVSCTEDGEKQLTCICGDSKTEVIPATGHNYEDGTCTECGDVYKQHEHNFAKETFNKDWSRNYDGVNGYRWEYESATTNSTRYRSNEPTGMYIENGNPDSGTNAAVTIWKITVPVSCTTQIGFKPYTAKDTVDPHTFVYLNDKEIWNDQDYPYYMGSEYKYKTVTLQKGDNYVKAIGYKNDCIELFKVSGESEKVCSICGAKPLSGYWNYTLNETDKTITLNQYIGDETDVIVHNTYLVNGTTYKTKIASNSKNYPEAYMFAGTKVQSIIFEPDIDTSGAMAGMFYNCSSLISLDVSNLDTSHVWNMNNMFSNCRSLTNLDLSNFDTSHATQMFGMFRDCKSITNLDLSNFDTSHATDMSYMFSGCVALTEIDLSSFDINNVNDIHHMFENCTALIELDLSSFKTSKVTDFQCMFYNCKSLTSLDISNLDTSNVRMISSMFYNCASLTSLDLSNFDTNKVVYFDDIFNGCTSLNAIYVTQGKWSTDHAEYKNNMFKNCGTSSVTYK